MSVPRVPSQSQPRKEQVGRAAVSQTGNDGAHPIDDDERKKAKEILKKRRLAAKGLEERGDGKPVDPLEDMDSLDPDDKRPLPEDTEEREKEVADRALPAG